MEFQNRNIDYFNLKYYNNFSISPRKLRESFTLNHREYNDDQHDSIEFIRILLNNINI